MVNTMDESNIKYTLFLPKRLHREIALRAAEANVPMRAIILLALKAHGLNVLDDEIVDPPRHRHGGKDRC